MSNLILYKENLIASLRARTRGDDYCEDRYLDELDSLWVRMTQEERDAANEFTSKISREYLGDDGSVVKPLPENVDD